jgi:hypothetical protein
MAFANATYEESLREVVRDASDVAIIRVDHREAVTFTFDGELHTCGYRYRAEVLRLLKGEERTLVFFSSDQLSIGGEYLVLAFRTDPNLAKELAGRGIAEMEPFERAKYICRVDESHVYVRDDPRTIIPFSTAAGRQLGGKWLVVEHSSLLVAEGFQRRTIRDGTVDRQVVSWPEVEQAIQRSLDES